MARRRLVVVTGLAIVLAATAAWGALWSARRPNLGAAERGAELFREHGCVACHGSGARGGVRNPGSKEREVPGFSGGTAMMYVETEAEIREWILRGRPARLDEPLAGNDALIKMPAYEGHLDLDELDDIVAYYRSIAWFDDDIPEDAVEGRKIAQRLGCFGCHGPSGSVGAKNPGSFKGYIPGWAGADFDELVRDDAELKAWILDGAPPRLKDDGAARWFLARQSIRMPAYRGRIENEELASLISFIAWLRTAQ